MTSKMNLLEQILIANRPSRGRGRGVVGEEPNGRGRVVHHQEENHQVTVKVNVNQDVKEAGKAKMIFDETPAAASTAEAASSSRSNSTAAVMASTADCFICCSETGSSSRRSRRLELTPETYSFFLKVLLEVPDHRVNAYLGDADGDLDTPNKPGNWIGLCRPCQKLIIQGHKLKEEITRLDLQLGECQRAIVEKMKSEMSSSSQTAPPRTGHRATIEIKEFVASRKYSVLSSGPVPDSSPEPGPTPDPDRGNCQSTKKGGATPPTYSDEDEASPESKSDLQAHLSCEDDPGQFSPSPGTSGECDGNSQDDQDEDPHPEQELISIQDKNTDLHPAPAPSPSSSEDHSPTKVIAESIKAELERRLGPRKRPDKIKKKNRRKRLPEHESGAGSEGARPYKKRGAGFHPFSKYLYDCPNCPQVKGYSVTKYAMHLAIHQRRPYQCAACMEFHPADDHLQEEHWTEQHANIEHPLDQPKFIQIKFQPGEIWKCDKCLKGFFSEEDRDQHELRCISAKVRRQKNKIPPELRKPHSCPTCQLSFRHFSELRFHRCLHHPEVDRMSCYFCDQSFSEPTVEGVTARHEKKMMDHMAQEHRDKEFGKVKIMIYLECRPCGLVFNTEWEHRTHMVKSHGVHVAKTLPCPICPKRYSTVRERRNHLTLHHFQSEAVMCDLCGQSFVKRSNLAHHKLHRHDIEPDDFEVLSCPKEGCSYRGVLRECLTQHFTIVHKGEETRPYICTYCGKSFKDLKTSVDHEDIHRNKETRPYKCDICGNSFAVKKYLYIHKRLSHEGRFFPSSGRKRIASSKNVGGGGRRRGPQVKKKCTMDSDGADNDPGNAGGTGNVREATDAELGIRTMEPPIP